ncbi:lipid IV(A) 3-deoxy-D-manno-octulosonic acid transferase [Caminibacter mediatlanticus]|uniref:3-deoxy-D-manno-octulosonic acid transferase n=1 Tax=Caminibacter mediatlanticus TB-2 TaxID=391592 RepID=A0AAI9AG56_9BACT|nr:lipid IV(A) 3-deoxy-D-manno-octulosonic acid transferase [Caminibacter mediatlanticus]EDM23011.1 3-deoxy-D-manno-octulosonic-acid transferase [Caminibacter mediatlanticus TB-2]
MKIFFFIFYYIFSFFIYLFSLPFLIFLSFKSKYKKSISARFFLYKNPPFKNKSYWFHSCSYGETKALRPIIEKFESVNISVITNTGYEAAKSYKNSDVRFLPFEIFLPFWIRSCESLVVMEAELWYMLFFIAKKRCKKTILLNARISDRSYPKYLKFRWFYERIFENIDIVLAQSEKDKKRLQELGAKNIEVIGNIKTYFKPEIKRKYIKKKPLIILASTHKNEEEMILKELDLKKYQVVVVPRHPERFDEVYKIMKKFGKTERINGKLKMENGKFVLNNDLILCDKMGELVNLYTIADVVILGGSFVDNVGGHNPIEAAYFNVPIISGKYYFNQTALYNEVENIMIIDDIKKLNEAIMSSKRSKIKNRVDLDRIVKLIKE